MKNKNTTKEYVPFGKEWEKGMSKISKAFIIEMLKKALIKNKDLEAKLEAIAAV